MVFAQHVYEWRTEVSVTQRGLGIRAKIEVQLRSFKDEGLQAIEEVIKRW